MCKNESASNLKPKAPEHSVVLWSPRLQHLVYPAKNWLFSKGLSFDQLIVCLYTYFIFVCMQTCCWNTTGMRTSPSPCPSLPFGAKGSWVSGAIGGPSIFSPTVKKSSLRTCFHINTFNYTFDTREVELIVEEVVIGKKENAKPLVLWNLIANWIERIELGVRNAPSLGLTTATSVTSNHFSDCTHCDLTNCSCLGQRNSCCSYPLKKLVYLVQYGRAVLCLIVWLACPLDLGAKPPGSRVFSPRNVRLKISISLLFWNPLSFAFMDESESDFLLDLRPKAPEHPVVLWSPRKKHLNHPAFDWLLGKERSKDQLIVCLL